MESARRAEASSFRNDDLESCLNAKTGWHFVNPFFRLNFIGDDFGFARHFRSNPIFDDILQFSFQVNLHEKREQVNPALNFSDFI